MESRTDTSADELQRAGQQQAEAQLHRAADQTGTIAEAVSSTAEQLEQQGQHTLARYASDLAGSMNRLAERLRASSLDDLLHESRELARRNPAMFVLGSIGVGLVVSRFLKASSSRPQGELQNDSTLYGSAGETERELQSDELEPDLEPGYSRPAESVEDPLASSPYTRPEDR